MKMILKLFVLAFLGLVSSKDPENLEILGIEPNSGLLSGETRVLVRIKDFDTNLIDDYPHPRVNFYF